MESIGVHRVQGNYRVTLTVVELKATIIYSDLRFCALFLLDWPNIFFEPLKQLKGLK